AGRDGKGLAGGAPLFPEVDTGSAIRLCSAREWRRGCPYAVADGSRDSRESLARLRRGNMIPSLPVTGAVRRCQNAILCALICFVPAFVSAPIAWADRPAQTSSTPENNAMARPLAAQGISAYESGDYAAAANELTRAQVLVPANRSIALYLGLAYLKQNRLADAIAAWRTYTKLTPATAAEKNANLGDEVARYLSLLQRDEDLNQARAAIARERNIGPGASDVVAITYYRNLGSPQLNPLRKGLTALLIDDVSKVPGLKVVERARLQALLDELKLGRSGLANPTTAARTGHLLGAGRVATGSYVNPSSGQMTIDSVLAQTSTSQVIASQTAMGPVVRFFQVEKQLANEILASLGYEQTRLEALGVYKKIEKPQTTNFQAFSAFSRGLDAKDHQDYAAARAQFQQALADDPNFEAARRELLHTPLAPLSLAEIESSVSASAPSIPQVMASLNGNSPIPVQPPPVLPVVSPPVCPPCPVGTVRLP
ncbi:MAG: tetratricopeptide repeat protein, partial [Candidatus Binataceae bacterium]